MPNPVFVDTPQGKWTLVAENIVGGVLWVSNFAYDYYVAHRDTGDAAPTLEPKQEGVVFYPPNIPLSFCCPTDVYVWSVGEGGRVRWDDSAGQVAKRELDGALSVAVQDQTTRMLDLFFATSAGQQAPTTTAVDAALDDTSITLTDATGISAGQYFGLFGDSSFYFGTVTATPGGNVIDIDTPLDFAFEAGSFFRPLNRNIAVDGSVTPVTFSVFGPGGSGVAADFTIDLTRIIGVMITPALVDLSRFGHIIGGLDNGIVLRHTNGVYQNIWNIKQNKEFVSLAFDVDFFAATNPVQGVDGLSFRSTFAGQAKHGVAVRLSPGERLDLIVQDDLSSISSFEIQAQGHVVEVGR